MGTRPPGGQRGPRAQPYKRRPRSKVSPEQFAAYEDARRIHAEPFAAELREGKQDELYRGFFGELVHDAGKGSLTVWMLAWRCKRCHHCWPVRRQKRRGVGGRGVLEPRPMSNKPTPLPKKCPGCDSADWYKDYLWRADDPRRAWRNKRRPCMLKVPEQEKEEKGT